MKNKVTVTAIMTDPEGKEIFRSEHTAEAASVGAEGKFHFNAIIHPMELVLTDAQRQFIPAPKDEDEGNEKEPTANTPGDDAIATGGSE